MKECGIIFNAEMVRAILDGRKTQTRRIMNPQPKLRENGGTWWPSNICQSMINIEEMMQDNEGYGLVLHVHTVELAIVFGFVKRGV